MDLEGRLLDHPLFAFPIRPSCPFPVVLLDPLVACIFPFVIEAREQKVTRRSLEVPQGRLESLEVQVQTRESLEVQAQTRESLEVKK